MTTKRKIIIGFSVLLVMLAGMAFFGFSSLQNASTNYIAYRSLANINVDASDLQTAVYSTVYYAEMFMNEQKPEHLVEAQKRVDGGGKFIAHALELAKQESTIKNMNRSRELLEGIKADLAIIQQSGTRVHAVFGEQCRPHMEAIDKALAQLAEGGRNSGRFEPLYFQTQVWASYARVREYITLFLDSLDMRAAQKVTDALAETGKAIDLLGGVMTSQQGVIDHAAIKKSFDDMSRGLVPVAEAGAGVQKAVGEMKVKAREILALVAETNQAADALMRENGAATLDSNNRAQTLMLGISVAGVVLGAVLAVLIIVTLVRTLGKMSQFASDIAEGRFDSEITITEKGEIGVMFASLKRIPEIFSGVIGRCNTIANDISSGMFRDRLDLNRFSGGFTDLGRGINAIADAYTGTIDNLPVGIVTMDSHLATRFTNTAGEKMLGDDALRAFGGKMPLMENSIRDNRVNSGENTITTPDGEKMDVSTTAMALHDLKGAVVGGLEVLTDISEIKQKQNIMLQVANEATAISDRVAAAAEELAAQVEEVSRGAEIQRERVETTASAMTEMNSTVSEVARSASEASQQSGETREQAESGAELVNKVVASINEVNGIAAKLQENMEALGQQAESIGSVMNVISDIADQTNLLALNAAIEAARAGEAGRGFAVVADEVRKLAENTMNATKEVGDNIVAIQHSARSNIQEVGVAAKNAAEATELANESGTALQGILGLASSTSNVVASIATAAEEQSAASEEITQAIDEINRLVSETTDGMIQSSSAVQDLSRTAQELKRVMEGLR
ncbi:methyl-accepting chemotaxis protein [Desulfovibrio sp. OttesenSCG-928-O18]|nr:methyl-accepting chemotaxis protein [Desulfovibrio sp. OttesenSCG-928-O18]